MCSTILQLVWTLVSPKRALTSKDEVVESDDAAYDLLALAGGLTSAHCTHLPYTSNPGARAWCVFILLFHQIYACSWAKPFWPRTMPLAELCPENANIGNDNCVEQGFRNVEQRHKL